MYVCMCVYVSNVHSAGKQLYCSRMNTKENRYNRFTKVELWIRGMRESLGWGSTNVLLQSFGNLHHVNALRTKQCLKIQVAVDHGPIIYCKKKQSGWGWGWGWGWRWGWDGGGDGDGDGDDGGDNKKFYLFVESCRLLTLIYFQICLVTSVLKTFSQRLGWTTNTHITITHTHTYTHLPAQRITADDIAEFSTKVMLSGGQRCHSFRFSFVFGGFSSTTFRLGGCRKKTFIKFTGKPSSLHAGANTRTYRPWCSNTNRNTAQETRRKHHMVWESRVLWSSRDNNERERKRTNLNMIMMSLSKLLMLLYEVKKKTSNVCVCVCVCVCARVCDKWDDCKRTVNVCLWYDCGLRSDGVSAVGGGARQLALPNLTETISIRP